MANLEPLMQKNFLEYASYVIVDRAIPDIRDGCKPVQRRILQTLFETDDGKFHKVANIIGETMKLHPHGDVSIGDALVVLANKEYFIEKQGNFGNIVTGHPAAASRYIECRLTDLARETLFNKALTTFVPSYDGRKKEPVCLPTKLPVILMLGTEGIAVGMSTRLLPHNLPELLEAQIKILEYEPIQLLPDFPTGGIIDVTEYDEGRGKVKVRASMEADGDKRIIIREIPYSTTTEGLIASIESAAQKGKVKISSISDFTTDSVEIEVVLQRGAYAKDVIPQLYAYTDCEVSISSNMVVIKDGHPAELSAHEVLRYLTDRLRDQICAELELELKDLEDRQHWLTLEQIFIEKRVYKEIEEAKTEEAVTAAVYDGMKPFSRQFIRPMTDEDVSRLLDIKIRRISRYDLNKNRKQIKDVSVAIEEAGLKLQNLTATTIEYLRGLLEKYGERYPRRSTIQAFEAVDRRAVAAVNIKASYDPETGFFGTEVKGGDYQITMSEYDRVLFVSKDGSFRIVGPTDKILIPSKVLYWEPFDEAEGKTFTVVYRDKDRIAYAKKVHILKFIREKEYELIKGKEGKIDLLLDGENHDTLELHFVPRKRQRVNEALFDLGELEYVGVSARGTRLAPKSVAKIRRLRQDSEGETEVAEAEPEKGPVKRERNTKNGSPRNSEPPRDSGNKTGGGGSTPPTQTELF